MIVEKGSSEEYDESSTSKNTLEILLCKAILKKSNRNAHTKERLNNVTIRTAPHQSSGIEYQNPDGDCNNVLTSSEPSSAFSISFGARSTRLVTSKTPSIFIGVLLLLGRLDPLFKKELQVW